LTLAQSITGHLVVAGAVKFVRGVVAAGRVPNADADAALDQANALPDRSTSRADVDVGMMASVRRWRMGLAARNLTAPAFTSPDPEAGAVRLKREVRAGASWGDGWPGPARVVVAADADLTERLAPSGGRRDVAAGVETWWRDGRLAVRGGVRGSTLGAARAVVATGVSAAVRRRVYLDAHVARGQDQEASWGVGVRVAY
jgi:hypothetical protein